MVTRIWSTNNPDSGRCIQTAVLSEVCGESVGCTARIQIKASAAAAADPFTLSRVAGAVWNAIGHGGSRLDLYSGRQGRASGSALLTAEVQPNRGRGLHSRRLVYFLFSWKHTSENTSHPGGWGRERHCFPLTLSGWDGSEAGHATQPNIPLYYKLLSDRITWSVISSLAIGFCLPINLK